jgi:hypothetical protein
MKSFYPWALVFIAAIAANYVFPAYKTEISIYLLIVFFRLALGRGHEAQTARREFTAQ